MDGRKAGASPAPLQSQCPHLGRSGTMLTDGWTQPIAQQAMQKQSFLFFLPSYIKNTEHGVYGFGAESYSCLRLDLSWVFTDEWDSKKQ